MKWQTLREGLDLLLSSSEKTGRLLFYGGEPLLEFPKIERAVEYLEARKSEKKLQYGIVTNGLLLTDQVVSFLDRYSFDVQLSFDGVAEAQALRGEGTFARMDKLIDHIKDTHPSFLQKLEVDVTLTPASLDHLADSVAYLLGKDLHKIMVAPLITAAAWNPDDIEKLDLQFSRILDQCLEHLEQKGRVPLQLFRPEGSGFSGQNKGEAMCGAARAGSLTLDVDGTLFACALLAESFQDVNAPLLQDCAHIFKLGHIRDPGFQERAAEFKEAVKQKEMFLHKEKKYSVYGRCSQCAYLDRCFLCPVSIGHIPGNTDPHRIPDFPCAFTRTFLKYGDLFEARWKKRHGLKGTYPQSDPIKPLESFLLRHRHDSTRSRGKGRNRMVRRRRQKLVLSAGDTRRRPRL